MPTRSYKVRPAHSCKPDLIRQNIYINPNQALLRRAFILERLGLIGQSYALMPTRSYQVKLCTNANQVLLSYTFIYIKFKKKSKL